jgi:glycosyltransferase involved in cell wall biosynthesis
VSYRVGYVVKRFPRTSETFIAQEILELERLGAEVTILTLWANDQRAEHGWLAGLAAPIEHCGDLPLSDAWKWLHRRSAAGDQDARCQRALEEAFTYPDRRGRHRLRESVAVADAALRLGLNHLHAHFANDPAFVAYLAHLVSGIPFSFTAHAKDIYSKAPPHETLGRIVDAAAFAVTVTQHNQRELAARLGPALGPKVLKLYNGVDLENIREAEGATGPFGIITVARLVEKKGVDTLLRALTVLRRRGIELRCTIVGDGPLRQELEELAREQELSDHLRWAGALPHEQVVAEIRRHDVMVLPARVARDGDRDALPTVLLEAMAAGLPCVSTPVGGIPEIIDHPRTGLLLPSDRPLALADALVELESNAQLRSTMGGRGRRRAEDLFDRRVNVARLHGWLASSSRGDAVVDPTRKLRAVES